MNAFKKWITHAVTCAALLGIAGAAHAEDVFAGHDLWITPPGGAVENFGSGVEPIPADFFGPGSDPFFGEVLFEGVPLGTYLGQPTGDADTIVERQSTAVLPVVPSSDNIAIELVQLSLVSTQPITVTFNGGQNPTQFDVNVELGPAPSNGMMTINHSTADGGTYDASIDVCPVFVFTEVGNPGNTQSLDYCNQVNPGGRNINVAGAPWVHEIQPPHHSPLSGPNFTAAGLTEHNGPHPVAIPVEDAIVTPSAGGWALLALGLLLAGFGALVIRQRRLNTSSL